MSLFKVNVKNKQGSPKEKKKIRKRERTKQKNHNHQLVEHRLSYFQFLSLALVYPQHKHVRGQNKKTRAEEIDF